MHALVQKGKLWEAFLDGGALNCLSRDRTMHQRRPAAYCRAPLSGYDVQLALNCVCLRALSSPAGRLAVLHLHDSCCAGCDSTKPRVSFLHCWSSNPCVSALPTALSSHAL